MNTKISENKSNAILESLADGAIVFSVVDNGKDFIVTYINKKTEQIFGITKDDVVGFKAGDVFPDIKSSGLFDILCKVNRTGNPEQYKSSIFLKKALIGWRGNRISKISDDEVLNVFTYELKKKNTELELGESDYFFQTIFETIQDGITVIDKDMNIVKVNEAMELWYVPNKEYLGKKCYQAYHSRDRVCDDCPARVAIFTGKPHSTIVARGGPEGTPGWNELSAFPIKNSKGETIGAVEYVHNITEQRQSQIDLENSQQKLKEIVEFLPDPTWVIDTGGFVTQWNKAMEDLTGIKAGEIIGKGNYEHALPFYNKRRPLLIDLVLNSNRTWEKQYENLKKVGDSYFIEESFFLIHGKKRIYLSKKASPIYDAKGKIAGAVQSIRDITDKKLMEIEKEKFIQKELAMAICNVKKLHGLLPICSWCKKIRDDNGYWKELEHYLEDNSGATLSHGVCPDCSVSIIENSGLKINKSSR